MRPSTCSAAKPGRVRAASSAGAAEPCRRTGLTGGYDQVQPGQKEAALPEYGAQLDPGKSRFRFPGQADTKAAGLPGSSPAVPAIRLNAFCGVPYWPATWSSSRAFLGKRLHRIRIRLDRCLKVFVNGLANAVLFLACGIHELSGAVRPVDIFTEVAHDLLEIRHGEMVAQGIDLPTEVLKALDGRVGLPTDSGLALNFQVVDVGVNQAKDGLLRHRRRAVREGIKCFTDPFRNLLF